MPQLSDEDRAAMEYWRTDEKSLLTCYERDEAIFLAGMRAGMERAAQAAASGRGLPSNPVAVQAMCIEAIREAAK